MPLMIDIHELETDLLQLVDRAAAGEEIIIFKAGRPVALLTPVKPSRSASLIGALAGEIEIGPDFDAPLPNDVAVAFGDKAP